MSVVSQFRDSKQILVCLVGHSQPVGFAGRFPLPACSVVFAQRLCGFRTHAWPGNRCAHGDTGFKMGTIMHNQRVLA
jgi:hypothetical protein